MSDEFMGEVPRGKLIHERRGIGVLGSSRLGHRGRRIHPEFIAGAYKQTHGACRAPRSRGLRSPRKDTPMRGSKESPAHIVDYEPVGGAEGYERVAVDATFINF